MSDAYAIFVDGLDFGMLDDVGPKVRAAAAKALNATLSVGRTMAADGIANDIRLPASYIKAGDRLTIPKRARPDDLEGILRASDSPISLARFVRGAPVKGTKNEPGGINVELKLGHAIFMKGAFLLKLRRGSAAVSADSFNLGLAVRTKVGERPNRAYKPKDLGNGLWLLYGPSVDQIFKGSDSGDRGVRDKIAPILGDYFEAETNRLIGLDL